MMNLKKDETGAAGDDTTAHQDTKTTLEVLNDALASAPAEEGAAPAAAAADGDDDTAAPAAAAAPADAGKEGDDADAAAADAAAKAAEAAGNAAPAAAAKAEKDPYEMPEGLGKKAQERFQGLVEQNKQKDTELATVREELQAKDDALAWIRDNVMTDEDAADELVMFAEYRNAVRTGDFDAAQEILAAQVRQFTLASGRTLEADPLAAFPDLAQKVADLQIDRETALELARVRHSTSVTQSRQQQQTEIKQQQEQFKQQVDSTAAAIDKMAVEWGKNDPDYPAKEAIIQKRLPELMQTVPLAKVPEAVKMLYESLSEAAPRPSPNPQPLRSTGGQGGKPAPASALDAMNQGLGYV